MYLDPNRGYDIIGDVHGCAKTLERLLELLGYKKQQGIWQHPTRIALFLGDIVDRGPRIREALAIVKNMVDANQAVCLMGNHEYYSLGWFTPLKNDSQQFVHPHTARNERIIAQTLREFSDYPNDWQDYRQWFQTLPLFIDAGRFRLVHACWDQSLINQFKKKYPSACITPDFLQESVDRKSFAYRVVERLLKGLQLPLLNGRVLVSKDGFIRSVFRSKFWANKPETYGDVVFQPDMLPTDMLTIPLTDKQKQICSIYSPNDPLLFVGHYWQEGTPKPLQPNLACLDYSAVKYGKLVAYRLDNEKQLEPNKFVWVEVIKGSDKD